MKRNWLTNVLLAACLIVLIGGQISNRQAIAVQPARAAEAPTSIRAPLAPQATSGWISVSAAAFQPITHDVNYVNLGFETEGLYLNGNGTGSYVAPVYLPQGAIVDQVACFMRDSYTLGDGNCYLGFNVLGIDSDHVMAYVPTSGSSGNLVGYEDNIIDYDHVFNEINAYAMSVTISRSAGEMVSFHGAKIRYHFFTTYLPSVSK